MKLNLGSGSKKLEGYVNIDNERMTMPDVFCDIGWDTFPMADNTVDEVVASHVLEHLDTWELFHCLREIYRVCIPGAVIHVTLPHPRHDIFLQDPTHKTALLPPTFLMFSKEAVETLAARGQGLTPFYAYLGVNFKMGPQVHYVFDKDVQMDDPELPWKMKHLNNIVFEWSVDLRVVK